MSYSKDALWKGIIEDFFPELMAFFYPAAAPEYDYATVAFLEKELEKLSPVSKAKRRYVDKLAKVKKWDGQEQWLLIHIEVQGYQDKAFGERMFRYYYRAFDRHGIKIEALAILTDKDAAYRPLVYEARGIDTTLTYRYRTCKLLDLDPLQLEADPNPFALVMLVALEALRAEKLNDESRLELKIRLFRKLLERGYDRDRIIRLTSFLQNYIRFAKPEMNLKFEQRLDEITENENPMGIIETIVHEAKKQATAKGRAEGKAKGRAEGKIEGKIEGKAEGLEQGKTETQEEMVKRLLQSEFFLKGMMTYQHIADLTLMPLRKVKQIHTRITRDQKE